MGEIEGLRELVEEFLHIEEGEVVAWLADTGAMLLEEEEAAELLAHMTAEAPPATRPHWQARLEMLQTLQQAHQLIQQMMGAMQESPLLIHLQAWIQTADWGTSEAYLQEQAEILLTDEAEALLALLLAADEEDQTLQIHQQLLEASRQQGIEATYARLREAQSEGLPAVIQPLVERIKQWIGTPTWHESESYVQEHSAELLTDEAEAVLAMLVATNPGHEPLLQHQQLLADSRREGIVAAYAQFQATRLPNLLQPVMEHIGHWMDTTTWNDSEAYLRTHEAELLTDEAEAVLMMLLEASEGKPEHKAFTEHQQLLADSRREGIEPTYERLRAKLREAKRAELEAEAQQKLGGLGYAILTFMQIEDDGQAAEHLRTHAATLLIADAQQYFAGLVAAAREAGNEQQAAHFAQRQSQWQAAYAAKASGPLRPTASAEQEMGQPSAAYTQYTILSAQNCAIGDHAITFNFKPGVLRRKWTRPQETEHHRAQEAVGREQELADLYQRLHRTGEAQQSTAIVAYGTQTAVRGAPGIGKTTLAALYATRYAAEYTGGVLWLSVGPQRTTVESVRAGLFSEIAAKCVYDASPEARVLLENTLLAADWVQALFRGHGPMLWVVDDVWSVDALREIKAAVPPASTILLTTRDYQVAFALAESEAGIQPLTVLTPTDARLLLQSKVKGGLPDALADSVAQGLGYHALALNLAAGTLAQRGRWPETAAAITQRVAEGRGFGQLPTLLQQDKLTEVEIALKYSYDTLGEAPDGARYQAWWRGLGALAQEASFEAAAAATLWHIEESLATEFLFTLHNMALVDSVESEAEGTRWQQHALLRAYALSLQEGAERQSLPARHADYYLHLTRTAYQQKPRDYPRIAREFAQIEHALHWCQAESPRRLLQLVQYLKDFMSLRGYATELAHWLAAAQHAAHQTGDQQGTANTLQSLGDLESRLGNIGQAREHYNEALRLYELEQDPMGKMNSWRGLAQLEIGLGQIGVAKELYEQIFDLAAQINVSDHPVTQQLRIEYEQLGQASPPPAPENEYANELSPLLAALLAVQDADQFQQVMDAHPALQTIPTLAALTALCLQALPTQPQTSLRLLPFLVILYSNYNQTEIADFDPANHTLFVALHEQLLPLAQATEQEPLIQQLSQSAGWALNTLGNHHAAQNNPVEAVASYTRALEFSPPMPCSTATGQANT